MICGCTFLCVGGFQTRNRSVAFTFGGTAFFVEWDSPSIPHQPKKHSRLGPTLLAQPRRFRWTLTAVKDVVLSGGSGSTVVWFHHADSAARTNTEGKDLECKRCIIDI
jgi:hypothetical protein